MLDVEHLVVEWPGVRCTVQSPPCKSTMVESTVVESTVAECTVEECTVAEHLVVESTLVEHHHHMCDDGVMI